MMRHSTKITILVCLLVLGFNGCAEPRFELPEKQDPVFAPYDLKGAVIHLLLSANRAGSIVYRSECERKRSFRELYPVRPMIETPPLDEGLNRLAHGYPAIHWNDFGGPVRVQDSTADAAFLNLRLKDFEISGGDPDGAAFKIWEAPEVRAFAKEHHVEMGTRIGEYELNDETTLIDKLMAPDGSYRQVHLRLKNATVGEILDRIASEYRFKQSQKDQGRIWYYEECTSRDGMRVAFGIT
jgi:hypothetical protein